MLYQFGVELTYAGKTFTHVVNCNSRESAIAICEGIFPGAKIISVKRV